MPGGDVGKKCLKVRHIYSIVKVAGSEGKAFDGNVMLDKATD